MARKRSSWPLVSTTSPKSAGGGGSGAARPTHDRLQVLHLLARAVLGAALAAQAPAAPVRDGDREGGAQGLAELLVVVGRRHRAVQHDEPGPLPVLLVADGRAVARR